MRWSNYFIPTLKEEPKEAEITSHKLMIRAGLVQKLSGGLYSFLPLGLKVLENVKTIIRTELNKRGALELLMPVLQPKEFWEESGRYAMMGPLMMKIINREEREFIVAPTHEEIITDVVRKSIRSYKDLPKNFYQIQVKFRDELRPRFGVIRSKEFVMKDGYSFHIGDEDADKEYTNMYDAYTAIFKQCGLIAKPVEADTGVMGGYKSHEFTVPAPSGEDTIVECHGCGYAANLELAVRTIVPKEYDDITESIREVSTPGLKRVEELTSFFKTEASCFIKTMIYIIAEKPYAVLIRGDLEVSEPKLRRMFQTVECALADEKTIETVTGAPLGFSGPVGLKNIQIIADISIKGMKGAVTGANKEDMHIINVCEQRDFSVNQYDDIALASENDICVKCKGKLNFTRGIEVGQVFKLGPKYSNSMKAVFQDETGLLKPMIMGCYGIGVTRTIAAIIECNNDVNGIIWPKEVAPFKVIIIPTNYQEKAIRNYADTLYKECISSGIEVLLDDRKEGAGVKFKDADLIGIPLKVVVGRSFVKNNTIEIKVRKDNSLLEEAPGKVLQKIKEFIT